ncbi:MAG: TRAP transporter small permease [Oscillospiraceae bacterium]|nr:TRAP transporter small permease [Oscillospiraceae bacterium]
MKFVSVIHKISQRIEIISCIAIVAMMLIVGINCITRQFDLPLKGTYDIACFLLVLITAPALCRCAVEDGHIRLDMLTNKFPKKAQYIVDVVMDVLGVAFCVVLTYALYRRTVNHIANGMTGSTMDVPVWPFILIETIVCALLALVYVSDIIIQARRLAGKEDEVK